MDFLERRIRIAMEDDTTLHRPSPPLPSVDEDECISVSELKNILCGLKGASLEAESLQAERIAVDDPPHWKTWHGPAKDIGGEMDQLKKTRERGTFRSAHFDRIKDHDEICGCSPYEHAFKPCWQCLGLFVGGGDQGSSVAANKQSNDARSGTLNKASPPAKEAKTEASAGDMINEVEKRNDDDDDRTKNEDVVEDLQEMLNLFDEDGALMVKFEAPPSPPPPPPPEKLGWWDHGMKVALEGNEDQEAEDGAEAVGAAKAAARSRRREASWRGWVPLDA